jgi:hypothetical protein
MQNDVMRRSGAMTDAGDEAEHKMIWGRGAAL